MKRLWEVLDTLGVQLVWADERSRASHWAEVPDVACSRREMAVSVPRRRHDSLLAAGVLHEVAHLFRWVQTDRPPSTHDDAQVCRDAIELARHFSFGAPVLEALEVDLRRAEGAST